MAETGSQSGCYPAWLTLDESDDECFVRGLAVTMRKTTGQSVFDKTLVQTTDVKNCNQQALTKWLSDMAGMAVGIASSLPSLVHCRKATSAISSGCTRLLPPGAHMEPHIRAEATVGPVTARFPLTLKAGRLGANIEEEFAA